MDGLRKILVTLEGFFIKYVPLIWWASGRRKEGQNVVSRVQPGFMLFSSPSETDKISLELDRALWLIHPINCSVISTFKSFFSKWSTIAFFLY